MEWSDIACIVFVCVTMNHLGLIGEIEHIYGHRIKVLNCPKCAAFWATVIYGLWGTASFCGDAALVLAVSFLASYMAIWLELFEGFLDTFYQKLYDKIYSAAEDDTASANGIKSNTKRPVPEL